MLFAVLVALAVGLTGLGFFFAWWLNSVQGFHSIMNIVLMPMWLLSGAIFPAEGAAAWVRWVMVINPLSYGLTALRHYLAPAGTEIAGPSLGVCWAVTLVFAVVTLAACFYQTNRPSADSLS